LHPASEEGQQRESTLKSVREDRKERLNNFEKRFAKKKKISTFAVPNKTGVDKRSLLTRKKD